MVGFAYDALKEAFHGEEADRLMLVQYETLTTDPVNVLNAVYDFLGETPLPMTLNRSLLRRAPLMQGGTPGCTRCGLR